MFKGIQHNQENQIPTAMEDTTSTSTKESNENDIQMKSEQAAFKEKDQIASEKLRSVNADSIYPTT